MRSFTLLLLASLPAFSQPITAGLKAGVPLTDFFNTVQNVSTSIPNRYIIGATAELRLPFGLGVEVDALYRHLNYTNRLSNTTTTSIDRTTANSWEFPLLAKYRFPTKIVRPYVDAGVAWDTLSGLTSTVTQTILPSTTTTTTTSKPAALTNNTSMGIVIGGGLDIHAILVHISPEIRYTRWVDKHFNVNGVLNSNQNQAEFLVGITF
jgi:hypothetical protein